MLLLVQEETEAETTPGNDRIQALMEGKIAGCGEAGTSPIQMEEQLKATERWGMRIYL